MKTQLLDFYAEWCGPCQKLSPILDELEAERDDLIVIRFDVEKDWVAAMNHNVRAMPTLVLKRPDGSEDTKVGLQTKAELIAWIEG